MPGARTNRYQNVKFSKLKKKLAILIPIRFDTPEGVILRGRKNEHNSFCTKKNLNTLLGSGISQQKSRDIPDSSLRNPRKTNFRGRARSFRPPPLRVEDPHPTERLGPAKETPKRVPKQTGTKIPSFQNSKNSPF